MPDQEGNPIDLFLLHPGICQKIFDKFLSFCLLVLSVGISILFPAKRTGNIVGKRRNFKDKLSIRIQSFQFTDCLCVGPHTDQMVYIVDITFGEYNHLLQYLRYGHRFINSSFSSLVMCLMFHSRLRASYRFSYS